VEVVGCEASWTRNVSGICEADTEIWPAYEEEENYVDGEEGNSDSAVEKLVVDAEVGDVDWCDEEVGCEEKASY